MAASAASAPGKALPTADVTVTSICAGREVVRALPARFCLEGARPQASTAPCGTACIAARVGFSASTAPFQAVLEPDGKGSHWFKVSDALRAAANADVGATVTLELAPTTDWPEPKVPTALARALAAAPSAQALWRELTPLARWDWIRWIGATRNQRTRQRRVAVAISKLTAGKRRPCCFDRSQCTLTDA